MPLSFGGGMSARRVCVLLLLAAVLSMHGVQCMAADVDAGHGMTGATHGQADLTQQDPSMDSVLTGGGHLMPAVVSGPVVLALAASTSHNGLPLHGAAFGAVCLAVLLTGVIGLVAAALIGRTPATRVRARAPSSVWQTGWSRLPRPPDLSALCLLRI